MNLTFIAIDGSGLYSFEEKHCDYCLVKTRVREQVKVNRVRNLGLQISIGALKQTRQELADFITNMLFMAREGLVLVH